MKIIYLIPLLMIGALVGGMVLFTLINLFEYFNTYIINKIKNLKKH